jgi:hypothetical protein
MQTLETIASVVTGIFALIGLWAVTVIARVEWAVYRRKKEKRP